MYFMWMYKTRFHCSEAIFTHDSYVEIIGKGGFFCCQLIPFVNVPINYVNLEGPI